MRRTAMLFALALAGCMQSSLTPCGDKMCPPGKACHAASSTCYGPEQLQACEGLADRAECMVGDFTGYCTDGVCLSPRCGDGILSTQIGEECDDGNANSNDPDAACRTTCKRATCGDGIVDVGMGEICDDGNHEPQDSCAPDCRSDQTCGNGIKDFGEECDDQNTRSRDGCSNNCRIEHLIVQQMAQNTAPRARFRAAMAYDGARERVVVFGGRAQVGGYRRDTWEWDGARWREIKTVDAPSGRENATAVYDSFKHRVVLFGGFDDAYLDDTWQYDGANWVKLTTATKPPARRNHAMAYDAGRHELILFGGKNAAGPLSDTWKWNGTSWTQLSPANPPPALDEVAMTYDPIRGEIVMFGGRLAGGTASANTYVWNGTDWATKMPVGGPTGRSNYAIAWDAARKRVVMIGGRALGFTNEVWEWDGNVPSWVKNTSFYPYVIDGPFVAYDAARRQLVTSYFGQTVLRSAATPSWSFFAGFPGPSARMHSAAAYDPRRGRVVLFGGQDEAFTSTQETWEWDGSRWFNTPPVMNMPGGHLRPAMTYSAKDGVVLFGGREDGATADLWKWNGSAWTQINFATVLGTRYSASIAYDVQRERILMYGGIGENPGVMEWTGSAWVTDPNSATPSTRHNFSMTYDPLRQRTLLAGGRGLINSYEFNGTAWSAPAKDLGIFARGNALVFDPNARKLVYLFDPEDSGLQVWEFNGATWNQRAPEPPFSPLYRPAVAFDTVRAEIVLFGGRNGGNGSALSAATTVIGFQPNSTTEACTSTTLDYDNDGMMGCADPDCDPRCRPLCVGSTCAPGTPVGCGDGTCDLVENCGICPTDCGVCPLGDCGDFKCHATETATCPGDCN